MIMNCPEMRARARGTKMQDAVLTTYYDCGSVLCGSLQQSEDAQRSADRRWRRWAMSEDCQGYEVGKVGISADGGPMLEVCPLCGARDG